MDNSFMGDPFGSAPMSTGTLPNAFGSDGSQTPPPSGHKKRGLHWLQTLIVLIVTAGASFLLMMLFDVEMAADPYLHPDLVWKNGLFFALLAAAILITAFLIEVATSAMTPRFSRKLQLAVVLVAIFLCGAIGALGELFFVNDYVRPAIAPTPTPAPTHTPSPAPVTPVPTDAPTAVPAAEAYIIALDKSISMKGKRDNSATQAVVDLLPMLPDNVQIGFIAFTKEIVGEVPLAPNSSAQQARIETIARSTNPGGTTSFPAVVDKALEMFQASGIQGYKKLIYITDGESGGSVNRYVNSCKALNIEVSAILLEISTADLDMLIKETGGSFTSVMDMGDILTVAQSVALTTPTPTAKPTATPSPQPTPSPTLQPEIGNMLYELDDSAYYLLIILVLVGLVIGIALTLMLSLSNQFRIQLILSPLMGMCAFLLIRYGVVPSDLIWAAYALFGVVLMRRNDGYGNYPSKLTPTHGQTPGSGLPPITPQPSNDNSSFGNDPFGDGFGGNDSLF